MARGKKKESALTPEEKLAQALVPVEEQPYEVPKNWCWTTLGSLVDTSKEKTEDFSDPDVKYVGLEHLEKDAGIIGSASVEGVKSLKNVFHPGQILYGKLRPYLNKHDVADFGGVCSTDILVFNVRKTAIAQYVDFFLNQRSFIEYAVANSKGINLPRVSEGTVLDAVCPLPPLTEQQRIVDRIEYLFAKLDEAKEKAQSVLVSFETRKAALLHKAFTGELTAKWRVEHGVEDESWHALTFGDLIIEAKNGTTVKQNKENNDYPVTRIETLQGGTLDFSRLGYIVNPDKISPADYYVAGDIAFSHINSAAHVGKTALIEAGFLPLIHGMNLLRIRLNERCIPEYFVWYSRSADYKEQILQRINMAVNQVSINQKQLKTMPINVPKTQEQREIVRILDSLLAKEQQAKETAEAVLEKIDLLKKSILARAFRGELGTNDPTEESAIELLKSVL